MLYQVYKYELLALLRKPSTYLFWLSFVGIAGLAMLGTGGYFDPPTILSDDTVRLINSPHELNYVLQYFNKFLLFLLPAIIGFTVYRDFQSDTHCILYSFPIKKRDYVLGKFLSGFTIVATIAISIGFAFVIAELMLGIDNPKIGPFNLGGYLFSYSMMILPNLLFYGVIVFAVVALYRNIYAGFVTILFLFLIQIIAENLFIGSPHWIAITDPLGQNAVLAETRLWTINEQNLSGIPYNGLVLYNRLFWGSISLVLAVLFLQKFSLSHLAPLSGKIGLLSKKKPKRSLQRTAHQSIQIASVYRSYNFAHQLRTMIRLTKFDFLFITKSWMFLLLVAFGLFAVVFAVGRVTNSSEFLLFPLTRLMISVPSFFFIAIVTLITFLFSGMLVHRAKTAHSADLIDVCPTNNWVLFGSKVLTLILMQIVLLLVLLIAGIGLQMYNGYYNFELDVYFYQLFVLAFPGLIMWSIVSVFVHTMMPNLYLGLFLLILVWIGKDQLARVGIHTHLLTFNSPPQLEYNDMNGYGHLLKGYHIVNAYWMSFCGLIVLLSYLFWRRGNFFSFSERIKIARKRFGGRMVYLIPLILVLFLNFGRKIYVAEQSENRIQNSANLLENFKTNFSQYRHASQPKIKSLKLQLDMYPEANSFTAQGQYVLVNNGLINVDTLLVRTGFDEISTFTIHTESKLLRADSLMNYSVHILEQALRPGDSLTFDFDIESRPNTLLKINSSILNNGTFLGSDILPRFGYFLNYETKSPDDSTANNSNYYSVDADLVELDVVLSTSEDQIAIAPGYLKKEWTENQRKYFHYQTSNPIKFVLSFNSGRYQKVSEAYNGTNLEVYYHAPHGYNIERMKDGLKSALDYNSNYFSPYQHKEARIIEFPLSEGTFATTMANSIPMSEQRFVINGMDDDAKVDLSFYVPAHELTHQWWGGQLTPADALGAKMLTESITEYISLRMYEKYFGTNKALSFLKLQRERYLRGRIKETKSESPLYKVRSEQMYIAYGKGATAFNAIQHFIGEDTLNQILSDFLHKFDYRKNQYPTTIDFLRHIKEATPQEYQYLITDYFEQVIFYDNKILETKQVNKPNNESAIAVSFKVKKYNASDESVSIPLNDFIEIGVYNNKEELISVKRVKVNQELNNVEFILSKDADRVVLDPNFLVIDKNVEDNVKSI